jgi:hypothetical protein
MWRELSSSRAKATTQANPPHFWRGIMAPVMPRQASSVRFLKIKVDSSRWEPILPRQKVKDSDPGRLSVFRRFCAGHRGLRSPLLLERTNMNSRGLSAVARRETRGSKKSDPILERLNRFRQSSRYRSCLTLSGLVPLATFPPSGGPSGAPPGAIHIGPLRGLTLRSTYPSVSSGPPYAQERRFQGPCGSHTWKESCENLKNRLLTAKSVRRSARFRL